MWLPYNGQQQTQIMDSTYKKDEAYIDELIERHPGIKVTGYDIEKISPAKLQIGHVINKRGAIQYRQEDGSIEEYGLLSLWVIVDKERVKDTLSGRTIAYDLSCELVVPAWWNTTFGVPLITEKVHRVHMFSKVERIFHP